LNALNCCKGRCARVSEYLCVLGRNKCANKVTIRVELVGTSSHRDNGDLGSRGRDRDAFGIHFWLIFSTRRWTRSLDPHPTPPHAPLASVAYFEMREECLHLRMQLHLNCRTANCVVLK